MEENQAAMKAAMNLQVIRTQAPKAETKAAVKTAAETKAAMKAAVKPAEEKAEMQQSLPHNK